VVTKTSYSH